MQVIISSLQVTLQDEVPATIFSHSSGHNCSTHFQPWAPGLAIFGGVSPGWWLGVAIVGHFPGRNPRPFFRFQVIAQVIISGHFSGRNFQ